MSGALPPDVRLANEIAIQFAHLPFDAGAERVAKHMHDFWEPRMLRALLVYIDGGGEDLDPLAAAAAERLRPPARVPHASERPPPATTASRALEHRESRSRT